MLRVRPVSRRSPHPPPVAEWRGRAAAAEGVRYARGPHPEPRADRRACGAHEDALAGQLCGGGEPYSVRLHAAQGARRAAQRAAVHRDRSAAGLLLCRGRTRDTGRSRGRERRDTTRRGARVPTGNAVSPAARVDPRPDCSLVDTRGGRRRDVDRGRWSDLVASEKIACPHA